MTDTMIRITATDADVSLPALVTLGWAVPEYTRARPLHTDRPLDPTGRWVVETVFTDGTVEFSAEMSSMDRADMWAARLAKVWDLRIPQGRCLAFFGASLQVSLDRFRDLHDQVIAGDQSAQVLAYRAEMARYVGRFLPAF